MFWKSVRNIKKAIIVVAVFILKTIVCFLIFQSLRFVRLFTGSRVFFLYCLSCSILGCLGVLLPCDVIPLTGPCIAPDVRAKLVFVY